MNLLDRYKDQMQYDWFSGERKGEIVKRWIAEHLTSDQRHCHRWSRPYWLSSQAETERYYKGRIADFKDFGKSFAVHILIGNSCAVLSALRDYPAIRDRRGSAWVEILESAFPDSAFRACEDCGSIEYFDDCHFAYNDNIICDSCLENGYRWSDSADTYVRTDDDSYDNDDDGGVIGDYHSTNVGHIPSAFDKRKQKVYLGLELEVECSGDRGDRASELLDAIQYYNDHEYCGVEHDGSLEHGFEIVTGYTGLDVHAEQLKFFQKSWHGVRSHDTKTCGLHVHICKQGVSMLHAAKMIFFINESANQRLVRALARRDSNGYAKIKNKKADYQWLKTAKQSDDPMCNLNDDRYEALNFKNENTIEFRLFKGTLKYQTIMACLEFTYATWFFTRDTGMSDLTIENFIKFICKPENKCDTLNLRHYLIAKGFALPKDAVAKLHPKLMGNQSPALSLAV